METVLVLTVVGPDRPGIVDSLSAAVVAHGGSWRRSRMAKLAGQFAGVVEVALAEARVDGLRGALAALASQGVRVEITGGEDSEPATPSRTLRVSVVGHDRPGIMRAMAGALAGRGLNVLELDSACVFAPMSGDAMFEARAVVQLPPDVSAEDVRIGLEALAHDMMVDFEVDETD
ncbi:MAG: glycine cleavage system protein R [Deltaproteobacteria bacterium]|nr:MAG: glycine cleavage system protein R [Deltaproteobacteria bacterium]